MNIEDMKPGGLVADGRTLLKVSSVYNEYITAQVVFPLPPRTTVRSYTAEQITLLFSEPSDALIERADEAWGWQ